MKSYVAEAHIGLRVSYRVEYVDDQPVLGGFFGFFSLALLSQLTQRFVEGTLDAVDSKHAQAQIT